MAGLPRRPPPRPVRHVARPARVPRAGHPAAAFHALRVREGARKPRFHAARLREPAFPGPPRADRGDHGDADTRLPARRRVRLDEGDRGSPDGADADVVRRGGESAVRLAALVHRDADHDPGRDPRPRLDPVALERLPALSRRVAARRARWRGLRPPYWDARTTAADQPALLARLHAAALHGLQPVPVAVARAAALVPGRHRGEPDDLRERGAARGTRAGGAAHPALDLPARARLRRERPDLGRPEGLLPT